MNGYYKLRKAVFKKLHSELPGNLYYHGPQHTINALNDCIPYLKSERITGEEAKLLRIGILLHDIGFTISHIDHEKLGVKIAKKMMAAYGFNHAQYMVVKGLILATHVPQKPKNKLERIICDVDLDYLGRSDFYKNSDLLYKELKEYTQLKSIDEWNKMQIAFLENHRYHTPFAIKNRKPEKQKRIVELKAKSHK